MQSKHEEFNENLTGEKQAERQRKTAQASNSHDFLVRVLTKQVGLHTLHTFYLFNNVTNDNSPFHSS